MSTEDTTDSPADSGPPRRVALLVLMAVIALVLDLVSKTIVVATVEGHPPVKLLGGLIYVDVLRNSGAAFSLATGMTWLLTLVALGVTIVIIRLAGKLRSAGWAIGLGLILGGALGNLVDRFFRAPGPMRGRVVDFVSLLAPRGEFYAVFNLADSAICVGGALLVLLALLGRDYDGSRARDRAEKKANKETVA